MTETFDFAVIGAGIAGASAAFRLAAHGSVVLLEAESQPGYHTTGRSAALYSERYRNPLIRGLAKASGNLLMNPPDGFTDTSLLTPRGLVIIGRPDQQAGLDGQFDAEQLAAGIARPISVDEACALSPALRPEPLSGAFLVPAAQDIDVNALHRGFLAGFARAGGRLVCDAPVQALSRKGGAWSIATRAGGFEAAVVVNAAGAWADEIAQLAGVAPIGLTPKRRTAMLLPAPANFDTSDWPIVINEADELYFKPDAGALLISPMDETPSAPCDAAPEELDVASAVARFEASTTAQVSRVTHRWAGLRTFAADGSFVVGFEPGESRFFWLAGQGGYGVQTAPALSRLAAGLIATRLGKPVANRLSEWDFASAVDPARLR